MTGERILNQMSPTEECIKEWAYDEEAVFMEQDEDLILHSAKYVPVLLELASDPACPKAEYILGILSHFGRLVILQRSKIEANQIAASLACSVVSREPGVQAWVEYFRDLYLYLVEPRPLTSLEAQELATMLLIQRGAQNIVNETGRTLDGYREYLVSFGSYREYLYINGGTGHWVHSRWHELYEIKSSEI